MKRFSVVLGVSLASAGGLGLDTTPFKDCSGSPGVEVEQLLTKQDKWSADPSRAFEATSDNGKPAGWPSDPRKGWHTSKSGEGYMHFYGEQAYYYKDRVTMEDGIVSLNGAILENTAHAKDIDMLPGGRGQYGTRNVRFATGRIEFSPDAFDMATTRRGAVVMEGAVPYNYGAWPAFWLMPSYGGKDMKNSSWAHGMEVDILELWKGPRGTSNLMYNAVQEKTKDCGNSASTPCEGKFTGSPLGSVGVGTDPWDPICKGCKTGLPESAQKKSNEPDVFYGHGFEWDVAMAEDGNIANATLFFSHMAPKDASKSPTFTTTFTMNIARTPGTGGDFEYSARFKILDAKEWTDADQMIGAWWTSPYRGVGPNYKWNVAFSIYQAWNVAYQGGMYMILNLAIGGDGHCCSQADLDKKQGIIMTNDLLNCTDGDSGWGKEFTEMKYHIRSAKFFNFDKSPDLGKASTSALAKCYSSSSEIVV